MRQGVCCAVAALASAFVPVAARAQAAAGNAVASAIDAFGERVGVEQIGLYDENQVRGFNLSGTGAYRLDGVYFARTGAVSDAVLDGVGVRVGANATRLDYPAASGLVSYRLKHAEAGDRSLVASMGVRQEYSPFLELDARYGAAGGRARLAGGAILQPHVVFPDRSEGAIYSLGLVPEWRPDERLSVRGVLAWDHLAYTRGGDYGHFSDFGGLPPSLRIGKRYFPDWARSRYDSYLAGVLAEATPATGWKATAGLFQGLADEAYDFTEVDVRPDFTARATLFHMPQRVARAVSGEARLSHTFNALGAEHQLSGAVLFRRGGSSTAAASEVDLGVVDLAGDRNFGPPRPRPDLPDRAIDQVRQETFSLGYSGLYAGRLEFRGGLHRSHYLKRFAPESGPPSEIDRSFWLWHASAVYQLDPARALFASYVRSLEDSGVAPQNARNRGQVLPPVRARQVEAGLRWALSPDLTVIAAGFDVEKPIPGLDRDNVYDLIGDVRHRGGELSVNGQLDARTRVVAGLLAMRPRINGPLVASGQVGARPVGVSATVAVLGVDHTFAQAPAWSIDAQLTYNGSRAGDSLDSFHTPGAAVLNLGARYRFRIGGRDAVLRINATNVLAARGWRASTSGMLNPLEAPTVRVALTMPLTR